MDLEGAGATLGGIAAILAATAKLIKELRRGKAAPAPEDGDEASAGTESGLS